MSAKRKVEIFSAGCPLCEEAGGIRQSRQKRSGTACAAFLELRSMAAGGVLRCRRARRGEPQSCRGRRASAVREAGWWTG